MPLTPVVLLLPHPVEPRTSQALSFEGIKALLTVGVAEITEVGHPPVIMDGSTLTGVGLLACPFRIPLILYTRLSHLEIVLRRATVHALSLLTGMFWFVGNVVEASDCPSV